MHMFSAVQTRNCRCAYYIVHNKPLHSALSLTLLLAATACRLLRELRQQLLQQEARLQELQIQVQRQRGLDHSVQLLELRLLMQQLGDLAQGMSCSLGQADTQLAQAVHTTGAEATGAGHLGEQRGLRLGQGLGAVPPASPSRGVGVGPAASVRLSTPARAAASAQGQAQWYEEVWAQDTLSQLIGQAQAVAAQLQTCLPAAVGSGDVGSHADRAAGRWQVGREAGQLAGDGEQGHELAAGSGSGDSLGAEAGPASSTRGRAEVQQEAGEGERRGKAGEGEEQGELGCREVQEVLGGLKGRCEHLGAALAEQLSCAQELQRRLQGALQGAEGTEEQPQVQQALSSATDEGLAQHQARLMVEVEVTAPSTGAEATGASGGGLQGLAALDTLQQGLRRLHTKLHVEQSLSRRRALELGHAQVGWPCLVSAMWMGVQAWHPCNRRVGGCVGLALHVCVVG